MGKAKSKTFVCEPGPYETFWDWWKVFQTEEMELEDSVWGKHKVGAEIGGYKVLRCFRYLFNGNYCYGAWVEHIGGKQGLVWKQGVEPKKEIKL